MNVDKHNHMKEKGMLVILISLITLFIYLLNNDEYMKYHEILKALIGIPSLSARLDNPFPLVGDKVTISSTSEWVRQHE